VGAALALCAAGTVRASVDVLTFEGLQNLEPIGNYYNGGLGGFGSGPGPNYGITFGSDSLALVSKYSGGTGNIANLPSGITAAFFLSGPGDVMNVSGGFTTGFSFYYSAALAASVSVYSGPDGTGSLLQTLSLGVNYNDPSAPHPDAPYNHWDPIGVTFTGTAMSVIFSGTANFVVFDDVTLGSSTPGSAVPEPSSFAIAGLGILGFAGYALRRRRATAAA
jgi:MYXO-CTERM domain-containing protein